MKISFDAQLLFEEQKTGIGWNAKHIIDAMIEIPGNQYQLNFFMTRKNRRKQKEIIYEYQQKGCMIRKHSWLCGVFYRGFTKILPISYSWLFGNDSDITQFFNYSIPFGVKGIACTIVHDMSYKACPETVAAKTKDWLEKNLMTYCNRADCIITDSYFSKKEIKKYLDIKEEKLKVVYCGVEHEKYHTHLDVRKVDEVKEKYKIDKPYFLYLGTLEPRKNISLIIDAFYEIAKHNKDIILVVAGKTGWLYEEIFLKVQNYQLEKQVIFTGYIEDEEVPYLLHGAISFIFPSLYEGFGLPVLEAMACGTPVITSNGSSLPEVGENAVLYVDISENVAPQKMSALMNEMVTNRVLYAEKRNSGIEQAKKFTWSKTAQQFLEIYQTILVEDKR